MSRFYNAVQCLLLANVEWHCFQIIRVVRAAVVTPSILSVQAHLSCHRQHTAAPPSTPPLQHVLLGQIRTILPLALVPTCILFSVSEL